MPKTVRILAVISAATAVFALAAPAAQAAISPGAFAVRTASAGIGWDVAPAAAGGAAKLPAPPTGIGWD